MNSEMTSTIKIKTTDKKIFEIDTEIARCSKTISLLMDLCHNNCDMQDVVIPLMDRVHSNEFSLVLKWLKYHRQMEMPDGEIDAAGGGDRENINAPELNANNGIQQIILSGDGEKPSPENTIQNDWDALFITSMDQSTLLDFIVTVNYLNVEPLLELICKVVTDMTLDKTIEQVRRGCYPKVLLVQDEIKLFYQENPWLMVDEVEEEEFLTLEAEFDEAVEEEDEYFAAGEIENSEFPCSSNSEKGPDTDGEAERAPRETEDSKGI